MSRDTYLSEEKERMQKQLYGWICVLLLLFFLVVAVNLRIRNITVSGNETYSDEEIISMILPEGWSRNPFVCFVQNRLTEHREYPFIASYSVRLTGPDSCEIIVYEKNTLGYIDYMSAFMYFDKDGIIIESGTQRKDNVPEITGLKFGRIVLGKKLEVSDVHLYEEIMNITQQLSVYQIPCSRIHFDSSGNVTLYVDNGDIRVRLGNDDYLAAKLAVLGDVIGEMRVRGMKGSADLSAYRDRSSDGFTFIPDKE